MSAVINEPSIKAILVLDSEGKRIAVKYYTKKLNAASFESSTGAFRLVTALRRCSTHSAHATQRSACSLFRSMRSVCNRATMATTAHINSFCNLSLNKYTHSTRTPYTFTTTHTFASTHTHCTHTHTHSVRATLGCQGDAVAGERAHECRDSDV
jgi:hypothetical protein